MVRLRRWLFPHYLTCGSWDCMWCRLAGWRSRRSRPWRPSLRVLTLCIGMRGLFSKSLEIPNRGNADL